MEQDGVAFHEHYLATVRSNLFPGDIIQLWTVAIFNNKSEDVLRTDMRIHKLSVLIRFALCMLSLIAGGGILFACRLMGTAGDQAAVPESALAAVERAASDANYVNHSIARPDHAPRDVVLLQLESLRAGRDDIDLLTTSYSLASPSNRRITGPFEKFAKMVFTPPYDALAGDGQTQVGTAIVDNDVAAVLVTVVDNKGDANAFRFVLIRQSLPPYEDCWMTEAVQIESLAAPAGSSVPQKREESVAR